MGRWFLINGGGTDENELPGPVSEQGEVALHVFRRETNPIHHHVKFQVPQSSAGGFQVVDISGQASAARRIFRLPAAIEQIQLVSLGQHLLADRGADFAGAANEENFQHRSVRACPGHKL